MTPTHGGARRPTTAVQPSSLPVQSTPFIGRQKQLTAVRQELLRPDVRLMTLIGPAGIGKTRLALEAAAHWSGEAAGPAFFVDLAPVMHPAKVTSAIARTLGVREVRHQPLLERLKQRLSDKRYLLVLDNFEQVVGAAPQVAELLAACPELKILATSRAALHVSWEHLFEVPPLDLPELDRLPGAEALSDYSAMALFVDRARAVNPAFVLNSANAQVVAEICTQLDGLPLAIELAAARTTLLSPREMQRRLQERLDMLARGPSDYPARHRTLRGAIAWSYNYLAANEQALFRRLSVFIGGCTLEAAEAVCNDEAAVTINTLECLDSVVGNSLLRQEVQPDGGVHFRMLETIREFGLERLAAHEELETSKRRHAAFFLHMVERTEPELSGPDQVSWLDRLERDHDNLRAALAWSMTAPDIDEGLRLAGALQQYWDLRGHWREGSEWLEAMLGRGGGSAGARSKALRGAGLLAWEMADYPRATAHYEESLTLCRHGGDRRGMASAIRGLGWVAQYQGDYPRAAALYEDSLARSRELGDKLGTAAALHGLGVVARVQGDYGRATVLYDESLALFRKLGDKRSVASCLNSLGPIALDQGNFDRAKALYEESLDLCRGLRDKPGIAMALHNLGRVARFRGDYARAIALFKDSLAPKRELGDKRRLAHFFMEMAILASLRGQFEQAARLFGAEEALRDAVGLPIPPIARPEYDRTMAVARGGLGEEAFRSGHAEGRAMTLDQAIEYAEVTPPPPLATETHASADRQWGPLTRREREVSALIARGLTNREIATALVITERTAGTHVQHILNKLGFNSRTQIAAWVVEHGRHTASP